MKQPKENDKLKKVEARDLNISEQMKQIETQIAELRGVYNYLSSLQDNNASVVIKVEDEPSK